MQRIYIYYNLWSRDDQILKRTTARFKIHMGRGIRSSSDLSTEAKAGVGEHLGGGREGAERSNRRGRKGGRRRSGRGLRRGASRAAAPRCSRRGRAPSPPGRTSPRSGSILLLLLLRCHRRAPRPFALVSFFGPSRFSRRAETVAEEEEGDDESEKDKQVGARKEGEGGGWGHRHQWDAMRPPAAVRQCLTRPRASDDGEGSSSPILFSISDARFPCFHRARKQGSHLIQQR